MEPYNTLTVLTFFLKIFTLHNIDFKTHLVVKPWPFIKLAVMLIIIGGLLSVNLYIHFTSASYSKLNISVLVTDTVDLLLGFFQYIVDLIFVFKFSSNMCVYFNIYHHIDTVLDMKYNKVIRLKVLSLVSFFLPAWLLASAGEYVAWSLHFGWKSPPTYIPVYFLFLIRLLTVMDINAQTLQLRYRLQSIIDKIEDFECYTEDSANCVKPVRNAWQNKKDLNIKVIPPISKLSGDVKKLDSYYLLLIDQTTFLNSFFGVRILLYCLYTILEMISFVNILYKMVISLTMHLTTSMPAATCALRFFNSTAVLATLVYHCETCYQQCGGVTCAIDRVLVGKKISNDVRSSLISLQRLVVRRPLRLHAAGFFNLDTTLLLSTASVVITYAVIIVQSTL